MHNRDVSPRVHAPSVTRVGERVVLPIDEGGHLVRVRRQARQREAALAVRIRPHAAEAVQAWAAAEREMASPLARLQALLEQHPEAEDREDAMRARLQLEGFSGQVGFGRQTFNQAVQAYNVTVRSVPTNFTAMMFGYHEKPNFTVENEKEISTAPKVDFNSTPVPAPAK